MNDWQEKVWAATEEFRRQSLQGDLSHLPVDVFTLAEIELRLDVIPFDDLAARFDADAAITRDFSGIYVDAEAYYLMERGPEWKLNRLRFSFAHEIGHLVLHKNDRDLFAVRTMDQFALWSRTCGGRRYQFEKEANEFAGRLLVPRERLFEHFEAFAQTADRLLPHWRRSPEVRRSAAESIAQKFGVHAQTIEARFDRENIWVLI